MRDRTASPLGKTCAAALCATALALGGCAPKTYVVLLESPDGTTGKVFVKGDRGEHLITRAGHGAPVDGSAAPAPVASEQLRRDFAEAIAARPLLPVRYLLYFSSGTTLTGESEAAIPDIIAEAARRPAVDLSVIGHTDTVYTTIYNEQLALRRANAVAELLQTRGVKVNTLSIESHGKRNLLVQTPDNTREPRNRRVEVSIR